MTDGRGLTLEGGGSLAKRANAPKALPPGAEPPTFKDGAAGGRERERRRRSRRKVLFLVPSLGLGGAERQVVDLVNNVDHSRFEATLFTFEEQADLAASIRRDRVRMVNVPRRSKLDARPVASLARIIREDGVELVHCTLQVSLLVAAAAIASSGRGVRLVDAIHSTKNRGPKEELADRLLYVPLMGRCDGVIAVCEAQRRHWAAKYPWLDAKFSTVHNGIDLERFGDDVPSSEKRAVRRQLGVDDGELVLGMVAAIRPEKNHLGVLEALSRLAAAGQDFRFLFIGGANPGTEALERCVRERTRALGLERQVKWLGRVSDPKRIVSILDAAVLFSSTESLPMALIECLAMGKPVISSRVGGVPELVEHGRNGLLVPAGDVAALEMTLSRVISDRSILRDLGSRARASVEGRFSVHHMARRTEQVLMRVLGDSD